MRPPRSIPASRSGRTAAAASVPVTARLQRQLETCAIQGRSETATSPPIGTPVCRRPSANPPAVAGEGDEDEPPAGGRRGRAGEAGEYQEDEERRGGHARCEPNQGAGPEACGHKHDTLAEEGSD